MQANNRNAAMHLSFVLCVMGLAILSMLSCSWLIAIFGTVLAALNQLQWFVLLHECGHRSFFPSTKANERLGHIAGIMAIIPFHTWRDVHADHHRWTGWKDLDPTTRSLTLERPQGTKAAIMEIAWRCYIPLFALAYRLTAFWNPKNCRRGKMLGLTSSLLTLLPWLSLVFLLKDGNVLALIAIAHFLFLIIFEIIMLSQHSHIPQTRAYGEKVSPYSGEVQATVSRTLNFPPWFARWFLIHFNEHERHHLSPKTPGYFLNQIPYQSFRSISWFQWWRQSHLLPVVTFLFDDENQSGHHL